MAQTSVELTPIQQLIEDIRKGNDISLLNDGHIEHYLEIDRKQRELISAQRYIDGFNKAFKWQQQRMYSEEEVDKLIADFKHDLREATSNYVMANCEGAIYGLYRLKEYKNK